MIDTPVDDINQEIQKLEKTLKELNKKLRETQRNQLFDSLEEGEYYILSKSWCGSEFIFKYTKNKVYIDENFVDSPYLYIDGIYIEKHTYDRIEDNHYTVITEWTVANDLKEYLSRSDIKVKKLSAEEIEKIKDEICKCVKLV